MTKEIKIECNEFGCKILQIKELSKDLDSE